MKKSTVFLLVIFLMLIGIFSITPSDEDKLNEIINNYQDYESYDYKKYPLGCLLYTSPSPRDRTRSRMPSSA